MGMMDRLGSNPEPWKPKPGDKLIGKVVEIDERTTEYGTYPLIIVLDDKGKEWAFHAYHDVAKKELSKQRPVVGDMLGVGYHGRPEGKNYEMYRVLVEHAVPTEAPAPDWDQMAKEADAELPDLEEGDEGDEGELAF